MGIFDPTEIELKQCGLSREAYMEYWIHLAKVTGMDKWSKTYSIVYYIVQNMAVLTSAGFVVGAAMEGDKVGMLEGIQNVLIICNVYSGNAAFHWYHDEYMTMLRTMDQGIFNYEGTIDKETEKELEAIRARSRAHKKIFAVIYAGNLGTILAGLLLKKPVMYVIRGGGEMLLDGENSLIREGPFGMYVPFANYWAPYIFSVVFSNIFLVLVCVASTLYIVTFQFISEDLLSEFAMIYRTLNTGVSRAERLFKIRLYTNFKKTMFVPLFVVTFGWAVIVCASFYLILNEDVSLSVKLPLPALITSECVVGLIICYYGELLTNASENIGSSIYEGERWTNYSRVLKPYAAITRSYCNIQNSLTAGGFGNVNHAMFANLCSTAYSYMGFLLST